MIVYQSGIMFNYYRRPTGFWMTNPLVYFTNNVAAGGEGSGIWFVFPDEPLVPSKEFKLMEFNEAKRTSILAFSNNVAHSQLQVRHVLFIRR